MEVSRGTRGPSEETKTDNNIYTTEHEAITLQVTGRGKHLNKQSMDYVLRSGIAGGLAGCAAKTVVGPLDRVKILFQASNPQFAKYTGSWFGVVKALRDINASAGLRGLFRGHSATLLRIYPYAGIKFMAYEQFRARLIPNKSSETWLRRFYSGAAAGLTSVFLVYPLEVIRVRLAFETESSSKSSFSRICRQIYNEQPPIPPPSSASSAVQATVLQVTPRSGLANFYRGFTPTLVGMIPYAGMSFLTHDTIGDWMRHPAITQWTTLPATQKNSSKARRVQLTAPAELFSGAVAGLVSQTASYPLEVIRRRMQVGGAVGDGHRMTMAETGRKIWLEKGWRGFFVGLTIGYMKVVPMVATSFFVYERGKWVLGIES